MLLFHVDKSLMREWFGFRISDMELISRTPTKIPTPRGTFIASLNHAKELEIMLAEIGIASTRGVHGVIFRTDNKTVQRWAQKWCALRNDLAGHRPRYLLISPAFEKWCLDLANHRLARSRLN